MRTRTAIVAAAAAAAVLVPTAAAADSGRRGQERDRSPRAVGLVDGTQLVTFSASAPRGVRPTGTITGLVQDTRLVGIDARAQDRQVYGVGDRGGVYVLDVHTAKARLDRRLTVPLEGTAFGVDFNPVADALRVVSDTGQNLRQPFATAGAATVADTPLSSPPAAGTTTGVTAAAYTNNDLDPATATTLFVLSTATDQVAVQSPANSGTLAATGELGVDLTGDVGFDVSGTTAYALVPGTGAHAGRTTVHEVSLLTGKATQEGHLDAAVTDLALRLP
ncbi:DUF4394 domain-containing protein [Kineococcus indalonis]|uniref:DUF4394 domain-containing protein n=1 Tax=Kineococcus indalonis TaxID=2696566 RepID=UPI00141335C4|nr:DUF4394 domain-containing protein [Kineococcus indalonis]NAZ87893.1 DUF4394 domain-containing protein [Kineococcus indalonis]